MEAEASPFPGLDSPLCCPLGCPAAQSLAPAHIPVVTLRVSGLELVSVRGIEFSQDSMGTGVVVGCWWGWSLWGSRGLCGDHPASRSGCEVPPCVTGLMASPLNAALS